MTISERVSANAGNANMKMGLGVFSNGMKPIFGGSAALNEGDILIFPPLEEMGDRIGSQHFMGKDYEFLVIEVHSPDGTERAMNWFPTTFQNPIFEWNTDDHGYLYRTANIFYPEGTAVEEFLKVRNLPEKDEEGNIVKSDTQKGVELLAGKKVKVTSKVLIDTVGFKNGQLDCNHLIKKALCRYDFVV